MSFTFHRLELPELILVRPERHVDARGAFMETYRASAFRDGGIDAVFVQDNVVRSGARVLRGLHYQRAPSPQGKLIQVLRGCVFDVAVDLRPGSATFGRWVAHELSADSGDLLWVPPGFGHGYAVMGEGAEVAYKVTAEYDRELDGGVRWDDPTLAIAWPHRDPVLSARDAALPLLGASAAAL